MKIKNFQSKIGGEIYYLVGALGDGCLSTEWTVVYIQKCKEWLTEVIIPLLNKCFSKNYKPENLRWQDGAWRLKFKSREIWETLSKLKNQMPPNAKARQFYIRAYWDAEGSCSVNERAKKKPFINFTQKKKASLDNLKIMINGFGIKTGEVRLSDPKKQMWRLWIENQRGIKRFCHVIGSSHPEKRIKLTDLNDLLQTR
ncbi:hypothetical protein HZC32_00435 [Candidatus Woesearchaeota archaeon]|nr:hypothetical protein [Candidatus Woesearchaeota archaeon]